MLKQCIAIFILVLGLTNSSFDEGVTMQVKTFSYEGSGPVEKNVTMHIGRDSVIVNEGRSFGMIYSVKDNNVTSVDHDRRVYRVIDDNYIQSIRRKQEEMRTRMQEMISKASPENRAMLEKKMHKEMAQWNISSRVSAMTPVSKIRKSERVENLGKYNCVIYEYFYNDQKIKEYCVVAWSDLSFDEEIRSVIASVGKFSNHILSNIKYISPARIGLDYFFDIDGLKGFPMVIREFGEGKMIKESVMKDISQQFMKSDWVFPLQGYKKLRGGVH